MRNLARFGYSVDYGSASDARVLIQSLRNHVPAILLVHTGNLPYWPVGTAHAVVLVELGDDFATLNDPAFSESQTVSVSDLLLAWSDFDQLYAVISPNADVVLHLREGSPHK